jgi:ADP-ribose pyrophosphatase YjhB (NUDIX family)
MPRLTTEKVVCYVVEAPRLLMFIHPHHSVTMTGVQVPAGKIGADERAADAAVRETLDDTRLHLRVVRELGVSEYHLVLQ